MKKLIALILALALAASLFVGCGGKDPVTPNDDPVATPTDTVDPTDAPDVTDAPDTDSPDTNTPGTGSETSTNSTPLVTDLYTYIHHPYSHYDSNTSAAFHIPQINLKSADIDRINKEIADKYSEHIAFVEENKSNLDYFTAGVIDWTLEYSGNDCYSLIIRHDTWAGDNVFHEVYNFNAKTGKEITDAEILASNKTWAATGLSESELKDLIERKADEFFRNMYGTIDFVEEGESGFTKEMFEELARENLTDTDAKESVRLYINSNNELHMIRDIASFAGAGWYERDIYLLDMGDTLITEYFNGSGSGKDSFGQEWSYSYNIPKLNFDSADAKRINKEIEERFSYSLDLIQNPSEDDFPMGEVDWTLERSGDDRFSLVIRSYGGVGGSLYTVYNFDLSTGKELSDEEVLADFGVSTEEFKELSLDAADKFFCELHKENADFGDDDFINRQREHNLTFWWNLQETEPFINTNGQLCMARPITQLAGGDGHEFIILVK